jgi:hypothetical protein
MTIYSRFVFSLLTILSCTSSASAHDSHTHQAPWQACAEKQIKDACSYTNGDKDLFKGSCQLFNEALMCVRNEPIIHFEDLTKAAQKKVVSEASKTSHSHH